MKTFLMTLLSLAALPLSAGKAGNVQEYAGSGPEGTVTYSLPSTTLVFEAEAVCEHFYAGPYARYASKYLGIDVRQKDAVTYTLSKVSMTPCVEADRSCRYLLDLHGERASTAFLKLSATGLVSSSESLPDRTQEWRFPVVAQGDYADKALTANLTTEATTLYRSVRHDASYGKVAVRQDMVVEKSEEARAAEMAGMIFSLREQRLAIITGDTDATYSGEAMGAAIQEITRLEQEYLTLFTGYSEYGTQKLTFDLVPERDRENQVYIAFRISDTAGLLPADNLSGKPVVLEIVPEDAAAPQTDGRKVKKSKVPVVYCRIPAVCKVKLADGMDVIMQGRVPVYQLGEETSLPLDLDLKD